MIESVEQGDSRKYQRALNQKSVLSTVKVCVHIITTHVSTKKAKRKSSSFSVKNCVYRSLEDAFVITGGGVKGLSRLSGQPVVGWNKMRQTVFPVSSARTQSWGSPLSAVSKPVFARKYYLVDK